LTSLSAENLLSFSEFEVDFAQGLNVIVGPNGAGKSNVLRLVDLVRQGLATTTAGRDRVSVQRYLRLGGPSRRGIVRLGVELTEPAEEAFLLSFIQAVAMSAIGRSSASVDSEEEQALHARALAAITRDDVSSLFVGRLAMQLEDGPPPIWALAYEFDHSGATYHCGLAGAASPLGWVFPGPAVARQRTSWSSQQRNLAPVLTSAEPVDFTLDMLLPDSVGPSSWEIANLQTGQRTLLARELANSLGLDPDPSKPVTVTSVFRKVLADGAASMTGQRRPPRDIYRSAELAAPVVVEDAGDLPLWLYQLKIGDANARATYRRVQELFTRMTGQGIDITATQVMESPSQPAAAAPYFVGSPPALQFGSIPARPEYEIHIDPVVPTEAGDVPIDFSGAGIWEVLVACAATVPVSGRVALLDEPAANLHPSLQRHLLDHLARLDQVILITHSPYLVPASRPVDLYQTTRLRPHPDGTQMFTLRGTSVPTDWLTRWRQMLSGSTDARAALFAQGVVLLEGDTERGAFGSWFSNPVVTGNATETLDSLNLLLLVVGSDSAFGPYVSYMRTLGVPWVVICDGPVLSPHYAKPLLDQLKSAGIDLDGIPPPNAPFEEWRDFWQTQGVFTVADRFGGVTDERDKSGEIEAFFERADPELWRTVKSQYPKSKVRAGHAYAEQIDLLSRPQRRAELIGIWTRIKAKLTDTNILAG
jgi:energy-coupling factor transporter ATP-binding protein EcfA2